MVEILNWLSFVSEYMSVQPDLTQTVVTIQNHNALDTPNNNIPGSMEKVPVFCDNGTINRSTNTLLLVDAPSPNKASCDNLPRKGSKLSLKSSECESRPQSVYSERTNRQSMLSCQLPSNIDIEALVWANVTHLGERIVLPEAGRFPWNHLLTSFILNFVGVDTWSWLQITVHKFIFAFHGSHTPVPLSPNRP